MGSFTTGLLLVLAASCGTTATSESHPLLANSTDDSTTMVYFIRPDDGFKGVKGNAFTIFLGGQQLLTIAKGEYTLVYLKPYSGDVTVESTTVINQSGMNTQVKVKESQPFTFNVSEIYYITFRESPRGYVPYSVSEDAARTMANGLTPIASAAAATL